MRAPEMSCSAPLRMSESLVYLTLQEAVVCVRRSSCERVTEREEFVGKFSLGSRLPQYLFFLLGAVYGLVRLGMTAHLITAMLTGAKVLARQTFRSEVRVMVESEL